jgi:cytidine deaminase
MRKQQIAFTYACYDNAEALLENDKTLLQQAWEACLMAYAPYSNFQVGAAAQLQNGVVIKGANQENASFPVGLCAERVVLSVASSSYSGIAMVTIAISYIGKEGVSNHPISPCGICRQSLAEYEQRLNNPIRLILGGMQGKVYIIESASMLLPLSFTNKDLIP